MQFSADPRRKLLRQLQHRHQFLTTGDSIPDSDPRLDIEIDDVAGRFKNTEKGCRGWHLGRPLIGKQCGMRGSSPPRQFAQRQSGAQTRFAMRCSVVVEGNFAMSIMVSNRIPFFIQPDAGAYPGFTTPRFPALIRIN